MKQAWNRHFSRNQLFPPCHRNKLGGSPLHFTLALVVLFSTLGSCPVFATDTHNPQLAVRVNNYTQLSSTTLARAEREAARIFDAAGLQMLWTNCGPTGSSPLDQDPCRLPLAPNEVILRTIPEAINHQYQDSIFGFATVPLVATINMNYVLHNAQRDKEEADMPVVLGTAIAHEIGHLLLGLNSHSSSGIMQPHWGRPQLRQALMGGLLFTPDQAERICTEVRARIEKHPGSMPSAMSPLASL